MLVLTVLHPHTLPLKNKGAVSDWKTVDLNRYWFISNLILKKSEFCEKNCIVQPEIRDFRAKKFFTQFWFFREISLGWTISRFYLNYYIILLRAYICVGVF